MIRYDPSGFRSSMFRCILKCGGSSLISTQPALAARYSRVLLLSQLAWHVVDGRFLVRLRVAVWRGCQIVWLRFAMIKVSGFVCRPFSAPVGVFMVLFCRECYFGDFWNNTSLCGWSGSFCVFFVMKLFGGTSGNLTWTWKNPRKLYSLGGFPASYVWWHQRVRPQNIPKGLMSPWLTLNKWD